MMNLVNNAVADYGLKTVIGVAVGVGLISYPIVKKVYEKAMEIFALCVQWISDTTFFVRLRSMACDECATHHRHHILGNPII